MKNLLTLIILTGLCMPAIAAPKTVNLKGQATFISEAPLEKINGTANGSGDIQIDLDSPEKVTGKITMPVTSMKTGNEKRDGHLRGTDWLDATKCPEISFTIKSAALVEKKSKGDVHIAKLTVTGDFGFHCKTNSLTAPVTLKWKGDKLKIDTKFTITLKDYAIKGSEGIVGSKVGKSIEVKTSLKGMIK